MSIVVLSPLLLLLLGGSAAYEEDDYYSGGPPLDLYCGDRNCYDLLGVTRDSERGEISKAYRKLAGKWHPDKFRTEDEKKEAEQMFMKIASGYEVLRDDESRKEYDYMLDHPEETFGNYYRFYKRRMAPKVDLRIVILALLTVVSIVQYYSTWYNFEEAINHLATVPKYRYQALEIAKDRGMLTEIGGKKKMKGLSKEEIKKKDEKLVRDVIADMMDSNGGYQRPEIRGILWVRIVLLPFNMYQWVVFNLSWIWRFWILREEYSEQEQMYLVRRNMCLSERQWTAMDQSEKDELMGRKLWDHEEWRKWKEEKEEEERLKAATSGKSKQERRFLKNGDNRMTFDENYDW